MGWVSKSCKEIQNTNADNVNPLSFIESVLPLVGMYSTPTEDLFQILIHDSGYLNLGKIVLTQGFFSFRFDPYG